MVLLESVLNTVLIEVFIQGVVRIIGSFASYLRSTKSLYPELVQLF